MSSALANLIEGELPLEEWINVVRATVPPPARWRRPPVKPGFWKRLRERITNLFRRRPRDPELTAPPA